MEVKIGDRIELEFTDDPYTKLKTGSQGTVLFIDYIKTVHIKWDEGSNLGLIPKVDRFHIIKEAGNASRC